MISNTKQIFEYICKNAINGKIDIGNKLSSKWSIFAKFLTNIEHSNNKKSATIPILNIPNYDNFIKKLDTYLTLAREFYKLDATYFYLFQNEFDKKLVLDLFANATFYDFNNIESYIDVRTKMLEHSLQKSELNFGMYDNLNVEAKIEKSNSNLEGPYKIVFYIYDKNENCFELPTITFGIVKNTCYLYTVQNKNKLKITDFSKKLDRYFRKINKGVSFQDIESNVSPNALVSLTLFMSLLKQNNIKHILSPSFMPIRYQSSKIARFFDCKNQKSKHIAIKNLYRDQNNITNKLMYLMLRYKYHFPNCSCNFDENTNYISLNLSSSQNLTGNIIYDLDNLLQSNSKTEQTNCDNELNM